MQTYDITIYKDKDSGNVYAHHPNPEHRFSKKWPDNTIRITANLDDGEYVRIKLKDPADRLAFDPVPGDPGSKGTFTVANGETEALTLRRVLGLRKEHADKKYHNYAIHFFNECNDGEEGCVSITKIFASDDEMIVEC